jgi:hypothetical protein
MGCPGIPMALHSWPCLCRIPLGTGPRKVVGASLLLQCGQGVAGAAQLAAAGHACAGTSLEPVVFCPRAVCPCPSGQGPGPVQGPGGGLPGRSHWPAFRPERHCAASVCATQAGPGG